MNYTIIIPSLDPDEKLMQVVDGLLAEGFRDIVLVNDGSHEEHLQPFLDAAQRPEVTVLNHEVNRGKGRAMKTAFAWCMENRPDIIGVVTVDGDNQHRPGDVRACAEALAAEPEKVWLGVRDFSQEDVPLRSRLGNTITRSFMKLACGVGVTDTQTGLRAISRENLPLMCRIEGERYEYETQMLLSLWDEKISIGEVVIDTVYIDENQTSHFNTLRDSWKIYKIIFRHLFRSMASFLKFSASSILSFLFEFALFTLFNAWVLVSLPGGMRELTSTAVCRVLSSILNFTMNRRLVFKCRTGLKRSAIRYFILALVQGAVSAGLIYLLQKLTGATALQETLLKLPVDMALFIASYQFQKRWVFSGVSS